MLIVPSSARHDRGGMSRSCLLFSRLVVVAAPDAPARKDQGQEIQRSFLRILCLASARETALNWPEARSKRAVLRHRADRYRALPPRALRSA